ncbi:MAG: prepilin-type N-terminal cleavage/methylation domain-containing protein [Alphaproteobacteria bacterium]|nr:prepilin-type N-terminal cleavage/methylation domain-containing protein [Alphaproteobacteria bacterium]
MKNKENGRSMVEMLGVLAIIGVLSAGALVGYSKAMRQHKLNKHTDEISYLLQIAIYNNMYLKNASVSLIPELSALGAFSSNITLSDDGAHFYDSLQNLTWFEHNPSTGSTAFCVKLPNSDFRTNICRNYINIFKSFADEIDAVYTMKAFSENENGHNRMRNVYTGKNCADNKCLKTMTNSDIINLCQNCEDGSFCALYAVWDFPSENLNYLISSDGVPYHQ